MPAHLLMLYNLQHIRPSIYMLKVMSTNKSQLSPKSIVTINSVAEMAAWVVDSGEKEHTTPLLRLMMLMTSCVVVYLYFVFSYS